MYIKTLYFILLEGAVIFGLLFYIYRQIMDKFDKLDLKLQQIVHFLNSK